MKTESDTLLMSLANVADLEKFMHELHERLGDREPKPGEDLKERATALGIQIPEFLHGNPLRYEKHDHKEKHIDGRAVVLVRPSHITNPVSRLRILCGRWGRVTICLECGWIWCRIVVIGRF